MYRSLYILHWLVFLLVQAYSAQDIATDNKVSTSKICKDSRADVIFVLDESSSIFWFTDFPKIKRFVKNVIQDFVIGPDAFQVGIVSFSDNTTTRIHLNRYHTHKELNAAIDFIKQRHGQTWTDKALRHVSRHSYERKHGGRKDVPKICIVITDGDSDDPKSTIKQAAIVKGKGITIFTIGVGDKVNDKELEMMASKPKKSHKYHVDNYDMLSQIKDSLVTRACEVKSNIPEVTFISGKPNQKEITTPSGPEAVVGNTEKCNPFPPGRGDNPDGLPPCPVVTKAPVTDEPCNPNPIIPGRGDVPIDLPPCPVTKRPTKVVDGNWGLWSSWGKCSRTCGGGRHVRTRVCDNPSPSGGGLSCEGSDKDVESCNIKECKIHGNWGRWTDWTLCTKSCNGGTQIRTRLCNNPVPDFDGDLCQGKSLQRRRCNSSPCSVDGEWGSWLGWSQCSKTCGRGVSIRRRSCNDPSPTFGGQFCKGSSTDTKSCSKGLCPIDGMWNTWQEWSVCSKSCGEGIKYRRRDCNSPSPQYGGRVCDGKSTDSMICNAQSCSIDGSWANWEEWSTCPDTCGSRDQQTRRRLCNSPSPRDGGRFCDGSQTERRLCPPCKRDGEWGDWQDWSTCTKTCNGGEQLRKRKCDSPTPAHGGKFCSGIDTQQRICATQSCGIDGAWSKWSAWDQCSKTCGGGEQLRHRNCNSPAPQFGGEFCRGVDVERRLCKTNPCGTDGAWSKWGEWEQCSKTCGGGEQLRRRICNSPSPQFGGRFCQGVDVEQRLCRTNSCGIDGAWSEWSEWEQCTKTCGGGEQRRHRSCNSPSPQFGGTFCRGLDAEQRTCRTNPCGINGGWGNWENWSPCSKSCGYGVQKRRRACNAPQPQFGGRQCSGEYLEERTCENNCRVEGAWSSWTEFSKCSKTCAGGVKARTRKCDNPTPQNGGEHCVGQNTDERDCNRKPCTTCRNVSTHTDIVFVLDGSNSIWDRDFELQKEFVKNITNLFMISESETQVGVMLFAANPNSEMFLNSYHSKSYMDEVVSKIKRRVYDGYETNTHKALKYLKNTMFSTHYGARPGISKVGILITDGQSTNIKETEKAAEALKQTDIHMFAIGVGIDISHQELVTIASDAQSVYYATSYRDLGNKVRRMLSSTLLCQDSGSKRKRR